MDKVIEHSVTGIAGRKSSGKNHLMKSSWNLGKTATMRVPLVLKDDLNNIARHLDSGGKVSLLGSEVSNQESNNYQNVLSQDSIKKVIDILEYGITSNKKGGIYSSSNAAILKKEVLKALAILQKSIFDG